MGEAKRRADANLELDACGIPRPRDPWCPGCGGKRVADFPTACLRDLVPDIDCDWMTCLDCRVVWEPFPAEYARDPVCGEPCDNCAFRPGSFEQAEPERWRALIQTLRPDSSTEGAGFSRGWFYCHKGVPIDLAKGPGNFLFPRKPLLMDGQPVRQEDGTVATVYDTARMRSCSGFLRMVWAHNAKRARS